MTDPQRPDSQPPAGVLGGAVYPTYSPPTDPAAQPQAPASAPGTLGGAVQYPTWPPHDHGQQTPWRPRDPGTGGSGTGPSPAPPPRSLVLSAPEKPFPVQRPKAYVWHGGGSGPLFWLAMIALVVAGIIVAFLISTIGH